MDADRKKAIEELATAISVDPELLAESLGHLNLEIRTGKMRRSVYENLLIHRMGEAFGN